MNTASRKPSTMSGAFDQLAVAWLTMFIIGSDLFVVSPLLPLIAADYTVASASAGLSVTVFAVTYALSAPVLGHIADRVGRRQVLIYCLCAFGAANVLTALSVNFTWLLATRFVAGAAAAGVSPSIYALAGSSGPSKRRATRLAVVVSGLLMSLSFGTPLGLLTAASFDWPLVFSALGVLSLALRGQTAECGAISQLPRVLPDRRIDWRRLPSPRGLPQRCCGAPPSTPCTPISEKASAH